MQIQLLTKRLLFVSFFLLLSTNFNDIAVAQSKVCSWSGTWQTNEGTLLLTQNEDSLKGNFKETNNQFEGVVSGRYVIGAWHGKDKAGGLNMLMSEDCNSFKGDKKNDMNLTNPYWFTNAISGTRDLIATQNADVSRQTFSIGNKKISFEVEESWDINKDQDGSILISSKKYPDDIIIYVLNQTFDYNTPQEKQIFLDQQKKDAAKNAKGEVTTDTRQIFSKNVDLIKIPQEGMKTMVFLPDTGNSYYMMTATYTDPEKMATAEALLASIMEAMFNAE